MPAEIFVWAVTKTESRWVRSGLSVRELRDQVDGLRCGLDFLGAWNSARCSTLLNYTYTHADHRNGKPLPFNLREAHNLYQALFGQILDVLKGKDLLIVPSGPLTQLPFQILVAERPQETKLIRRVFAKTSWLIMRHAITILPSVPSLHALRAYAKASQARKPYVGFGNPLLDGDPISAKLARKIRGCAEVGRARTPQLRSTHASILPLGRGTRLADMQQIRSQIALPETAGRIVRSGTWCQSKNR